MNIFLGVIARRMIIISYRSAPKLGIIGRSIYSSHSMTIYKGGQKHKPGRPGRSVTILRSHMQTRQTAASKFWRFTFFTSSRYPAGYNCQSPCLVFQSTTSRVFIEFPCILPWESPDRKRRSHPSPAKSPYSALVARSRKATWLKIPRRYSTKPQSYYKLVEPMRHSWLHSRLWI